MGYYICDDCDVEVPGPPPGHDQPGPTPLELCALCTEIRELKARIRRAIDIGSATYQGNGPIGPVARAMISVLMGEHEIP